MTKLFEKLTHLFRPNAELDKKKQSLADLVKRARDVIPVDASDIWIRHGENWFHGRSLLPNTLIFRELTEKRVPGITKREPLGDLIHPTMLYRATVRFTENGEIDFEVIHRLKDHPSLQVTSDNKEFAARLNSVLNVTRVPIVKFHLPLHSKEHDTFKNEYDRAYTLISAFIRSHI